MRGVDEVVRQRLVHVIDDVQPLRGYDAVLLAPQVASECLQTDLVWRGEGTKHMLTLKGIFFLLFQNVKQD